MSRQAIPVRTDISINEIKIFMWKCKIAKVCLRLLAIIAILEGENRTNAAARYQMSIDTLRFWVNRFNEFGIDGLYNQKPPGRPPKLNPDQQSKFFKAIEAGPELETDGIVRWRLYDMTKMILDNFDIHLTEAAVWYILKNKKFSVKAPRPRHPKQDPDDIPKFQIEFNQLAKSLTAHVPKKTPRYVWFQDETRLGDKNNRAKIWSPAGVRPIVPADMGYHSAYLYGAICPELGKGIGLISPVTNTYATQLHLELVSEEITDQAHGILVMDRATWHTTKQLKIPKNITIIFLPPYCPELNPIEQVWDYLRENYLANRYFNSHDALLDGISDAWNQFRHLPNKITEIGTRKWIELK